MIAIESERYRFNCAEPVAKLSWTVTMSRPSYSAVLDSTVVHCSSELALLREWAKSVCKTEALAIVFHNGNNFDVPYLFERAKVVGLCNFHDLLSPFGCMRARFYRKTRSTAEGIREWGLFDLPGLCLLDSMECVRQEGYKLSSYALKEVVWRFLACSATPEQQEPGPGPDDTVQYLLKRAVQIPADQRQNLMYRATLADQTTLENEAVLSDDGARVQLKRFLCSASVPIHLSGTRAERHPKRSCWSTTRRASRWPCCGSPTRRTTPSRWPR